MKFFVPEWDDKVDSNYDFLNDNHSGSPSERDSDYIWHIFGWENVPIDGVLISRAKAEDTKKKYKAMREDGFYSYLNLPKEIETISDCGAFDYIDGEEPRYEPREMMEFYKDVNVTTGVTIDHLITKKDQEDKEYRYDITLENAKRMYDLWVSNDDYFENMRLMGALQGWDSNSYGNAANELMNYGFRYLGIGGIARTQTPNLKEIIKRVGQEVKDFERKNNEKVDIHLFGFARSSLFDVAAKSGVSSFDSASMLRRAWLGVQNNYHLSSEQQFGGLRVRYAKSAKRSLKKSAEEKKENNIELSELEKLCLEDSEKAKEKIKGLEQETLEKLREYDRDEIGFEEAYSTLKRYEDVSGDPDKNLEYYRETLRQEPWKECSCPICSDLGVEVCIFRGNNRNRRRGFHNTHVFYEEFRDQIPEVLVFTTCTNTKRGDEGKIPAYQRYEESKTFKSWWNQVFDLPVVELGVLSAKYGLIPWWERIPNYDYKMQESDVEEFVDELSHKLVRFDKVFFHGLGLYKEVVEKVDKEIDTDIEIFPKQKLTDRDLDIIEYTKQAKELRERILDYLGYEGDFVPELLSQEKLGDF